MKSNWKPSANFESLRQRQKLTSRVRNYFDQLGFLEVETPILSAFATPDLHLDSISCSHGFLQTSPEYPMKRLLAAGSGAIYQICKVFRAGESGRKHNPEFTMLEWYQPGWDDKQLMRQVVDLLNYLGHRKETSQFNYRTIFQQITGLDPLTCTNSQLISLSSEIAARDCSDFSRNDCLDLIMSLVVEPALNPDKITLITDFPASQAALAIKEQQKDNTWTAKRFEVYSSGIELANGYAELVDAEEQQCRFNDENDLRRLAGKNEMPTDINFIQALHHGLPQCAGVAIGLDRLFMLCLKQDHIDDVIAFPMSKA